jgi:hypothetical protein
MSPEVLKLTQSVLSPNMPTAILVIPLPQAMSPPVTTLILLAGLLVIISPAVSAIVIHPALSRAAIMLETSAD